MIRRSGIWRAWFSAMAVTALMLVFGLHSCERAPEFDHRLVGREETSIHENHHSQSFNVQHEQDSYDLRETLFAQENSEDPRSAEDRFRASTGDSRGSDPRTLHERGRQRHLEPGQRRCHAQVPGRSWMAVEDSPRLARADQPGPGPEQGSSAQSRECHDDRPRGSACRNIADSVSQREPGGRSCRPKLQPDQPIATAIKNPVQKLKANSPDLAAQ